MAYLLIIVVVALAGITKITLQQRREHKFHVENDFRTSLEKVATQPLARGDDGPRRRWELAGWNDRKRAREERTVTEKPKRVEQTAPSRRPARRTESREAPRRVERSSRRHGARRPAATRPDRGRSRREDARDRRAERVMHRRADRGRVDQDVDWFEDLRSQPSHIRLDTDPAPARLPVSSRRTGQPSTRGRLQPQFHARIHPAHLPPSQEPGFDLGPARAYSRQRAV